MIYWDALSYFTNELNSYRASNGLNLVWLNHDLSEECQKHNAYMASIGHLEHSDRSICDLRENVGVKTFFGCINFFNEAKYILDMWMGCQFHKETLLASGSEIGIALYIHYGKIYATFRIR